MMSNKVIPIVVATDDNYALLLKVFLKSLLYTKKPTTIYDVYVFISSLTEKNKEWIKREEREGLKVNFVDVSEYLKGQHFYAGNYAIAMYYRFFAPEILKEYKKIIYCDVDTVVNGDLGDLLDLDLGENIIGAVNESWGDIERICDWKHFNSGVLVIDTEKFLKEYICKKCVEYINLNQSLRFPDQDALNKILFNKVLFINAKFNYQTAFLNKKTEKIYNEVYSIKNLKHITIIHFCGSRRPWYYSHCGIKDKLSRKWWYFSKCLQKDEKAELRRFRLKGYNIFSKNKIFALRDLNNDFEDIKAEKGSFYANLFYIKNYVKILLK